MTSISLLFAPRADDKVTHAGAEGPDLRRHADLIHVVAHDAGA